MKSHSRHSTPAVVIIALAIMTLLSASCRSDEPGQDYGNFRYDMVTYRSYEGGKASFGYISRDDAPEITLLAATESVPKLKYGDRVLLYYYPGVTKGQTQEITMRYYVQVITDTLKLVEDAAIDTMKMEPVRLRSMWRTGQYINVHCEAPYTEKSRVIDLVAGKKAAESAAGGNLNCYFIHDTKGQTTYFHRACYVSFFVGDLTQKAPHTTLQVNIADEIRPDAGPYAFTLP